MEIRFKKSYFQEIFSDGLLLLQVLKVDENLGHIFGASFGSGSFDDVNVGHTDRKSLALFVADLWNTALVLAALKDFSSGHGPTFYVPSLP